ncbi:acyl-CoA carboxylase subunit epsilon [Streptomyces camelliae]|uniref:Acyl-CoA carboxylase subunit epsilon n=1 Tax=Streptomyces camelliae TaxID=3004093 RepID=A0ABY7P391_9ACTN|nr:acyl-CoA carboxylase subunit epsilon [Streptomyces sp. HUAS 2-6]WBO64996.1 acyl-CoA carboxylase subunit epsilon [Streptomyces sp. HUAS 2-6]
MTSATVPTVQIVKGEATDDELAALTVVLMARAAAARRVAQPRFAHGDRHPRARWRRLDRVTSYRNPVSWR